MLNIITANDKDKWNDIVRSFEKWDVYYLCEYAESFYLHGDGTPLLIYYSYGSERFCYVVLRRDISSSPQFDGQIKAGLFYDFESPYGYGGPLCDHVVSEPVQLSFLKEMNEYARANGIVSQFVRFHPLLMNHLDLQSVFETRYLHQTIYIDTSSPDVIFKNMDSKNRNMVRKAEKNGIIIVRKGIEDYSDFMPIYEETMIKDNASDYYFFDEEYFKAQQELKNNSCIFYAMKENIPISAAIMYFNNHFMHYHLAGTHTEFRKLSPNNLLLYKAACWANERGIEKFHLGGGIVEDDNLFGFKKQFNKNGRLPFYIGRTVFNNDSYKFLMNERKKRNPDFNMENNRMIQYLA